MKFLQKIEITKFRSFGLKETIELDDVNIFSGSNDSGKSNILKAVNLFFNERTDQFPYNSDTDFNKWFRDNDIRGKRDIIIKMYLNHGNYYDKTTQNRKGINGGFNVEKIFHDNGSIETHFYYPDNTEINDKFSLTRADSTIRERIKFIYIPAIREIGFRKSIQRQLEYIADATDKRYKRKELKKAFGDLETGLKTQLADLASVVNRSLLLDIKTEVTFSALLESLTFSTYGEIEIKKKGAKVPEKQAISLLNRGDGIQMHFLAFLLWYLAKEDKKHSYIWGFEEPEIALEIKRQFSIADTFDKVFSKQVQILLTTHSPAFAFYDGLDPTRLKKYRVSLESDKSKRKRLVTKIKAIDEYYEGLFSKLKSTSLTSEKSRLELDIWGIEAQKLSNMLGSSLDEIIDLRHISRQEFQKILDDIKRVELINEQQNKVIEDVTDELKKTFPKKIFIYEDKEGESIWKSFFKKFGIDCNEIDFRCSHGCTNDSVELSIIELQKKRPSYNPKIFRQLDLDGYLPLQKATIENIKISKYIQLRKYKICFLPVNEMENFVVLTNPAFNNLSLQIDNYSILSPFFLKTAKSNLRNSRKIDAELFKEDKEYEMLEHAQTDWKRLLNGKELCKLDHTIKPKTFLKGLQRHEFPTDLVDYLTLISQHFN